MKIKVRKGLQLRIEGGITGGMSTRAVLSRRCGIVPEDYHGFEPKPAVRQGDYVAVGTPLLYDKNEPSVKLVSPLAGKVVAVCRGERRKILYVEVVADTDKTAPSPEFATPADSASARKFLAESGLLAEIRRRPYDIVPGVNDEVRDIFITAIDSAPLSAPLATLTSELYAKGDIEEGVRVLSLISAGKVYICHDGSWPYGDIDGAVMVEVEGSGYPVGNPSVHISAVSPINKGETVWALDLMTLGRIGRTCITGSYDPRAVVAVTGPEVVHPEVVGTIIGAPIADITKGNVKEDGVHHRIISGNVLTGTAVDAAEGFLRYPYRQVTVIAEGDDVDEFMGWASMSAQKMSESRSFPSHFRKGLFRPDSRILGGRRAMIMSGEYDKYIPLDIMPEYLIKAILSHNIDDMEALGIYEVAPEDFAGAEYADTSKLPLQQIVRDGLDYLRHEI